MKKRVHISLTHEEYNSLIELAKVNGCWWGSSPSLSVLISAIASNQFQLIKNKQDF